MRLRTQFALAWMLQFGWAGMLSSAAGEPVVPPAEKKPELAPSTTESRLEALEKRIRLLEQSVVEKDARIAELQRKQEEATAPGALTGPGFRFQLGADDMQRFQRRLDDYLRGNLDDLFEHGQPRRGGGGEDEDWMNRRDPFFDRELPVPGLRGTPAPSRKPRLGVYLETASDELRVRYRNAAQEGAFVTSVAPQSAADKAGLLAGDCIIQWDGKTVRTADGLVEEVKKAAEGQHKIGVLRRGEEVALEIVLPKLAEEPPLVGKPDAAAGGGNWWRRPQEGRGERDTRNITEVRSGALELTAELAKELKLDDKQRRKMEEVLAVQSRKLSEEYGARTERQGRLGRPAPVGSDLKLLVEECLAAAEKELKDVLSDGQLKSWRVYSAKHKDDLFISRRVQIQERQPAGEGLNF